MQTIQENTFNPAVKSYFEDLKNGCNNLITCKQLEEEMKNGKGDLYLLDIRKPDDFNEGHIEGAVNIPWAEVGEFLEDLPKNCKIINICYSGQTAGQLTGIMKILGFDVCSLKGGMSCDKAHLPISAGCSS